MMNSHRYCLFAKLATRFRSAVPWVVLCIALAAFCCESAKANSPGDDGDHSSTVGYPAQIRQLVIAGPELKAKPIENRKQALLVRLIEIYPHGSDFRYDIEFTGLEPGIFNLGEYLEPVDSSDSNWTAPTIPVTIRALLPPGQVEPSELAIRENRFQSYYLATLVVGGVVWAAGLFVILFSGRGKIFRSRLESKPVTVADRLKPLMEKAVSGDLTTAEKAELERVLVAFWRKKLRLQHLPASDLRSTLREHAEAGKMLDLLDRWLHQPANDDDFDIEELIKPYQTVNYDEI